MGQKKEFCYTRKAQYYETDQMGIVHHSNYIRWFEEARIAWLDELGLNYRTLEERKILIPVLSASCTYRQSVKFDETVDIYASMKAFHGLKFEVHYRVADHETGMLMAEGETGHCFLNEKMQPFRLKKEAPDVYEIFRGLEEEE
ncbi:MAG: acyl-CoA thioesterase [Lachnospiraceae bacterium]|nr:acyl-CoA thioesterase [Lachnospiraceae bacterium]